MQKVKVLIVDDSSVMRGIIKEVLADYDDINVVGEAADPFAAREMIKKLNPDVLTLDVEMPKMDGITFLSNLMRLRPMPVVMLSSLTTKGADVTLRALELGALDFIPKPNFKALTGSKGAFKSNLIEKLRFAGEANTKNLFHSANQVSPQKGESILNFTRSLNANHIIAIGASTGGTDAIKKLLTRMPAHAPAIVITLHIPSVFSDRFAQRMNKLSAMTVKEARHGEQISQGNVYIAPGNQHLKVAIKNGMLICILEDSPEVNRHKPAVDVLFNSLQPLANNVQALILTGMGQDGAKGLQTLKSLGAMTIVQDQNTSLVWGMPGCAYQLNAHRQVLPLPEIASVLLDNAKFGWENINKGLADG
jgi:two-component system chemotaxis response regulator CheB